MGLNPLAHVVTREFQRNPHVVKEISEAAGVGESEVKQTMSFRNQQILPLESSLQDDGLTLP